MKRLFIIFAIFMILLTFQSCFNIYYIDASSSDGGTISPSGTVPVRQWSNQTFSFTPNSGYQLQSIVVDDQTLSAVPSYTFIRVISNHTIRANFQLVGNSNGSSEITVH